MLKYYNEGVMDKRIKQYDTGSLFDVVADSWKQAQSAWKKTGLLPMDTSKIRNIIITGLGGSAISGDLLKNFLGDELKLSLSVNRTYSMPPDADSSTLVIASSYSGNTEETLSAVKDAAERNCMIVALTTGGELARFAAEMGFPVVILQEGFQPRYALYNSFFTLLRLFQDLGFAGSQEQIVMSIIEKFKVWSGEFSAPGSRAEVTAEKLSGRIPVIYSIAGLNDAAGRRFKGQLNENSKVHAWASEYPEMNHNEIVGWESESGPGSEYIVINISDREMNGRIAKRMNVINFLLSERKIDILTVEGRGGSFKERLIECVYFCDWVSYYLAIINGKDPAEIDYIHYLKKKMSEV